MNARWEQGIGKGRAELLFAFDCFQLVGMEASNADAPSPELLLNVVLDLSPNCLGGEVTANKERLPSSVS
ncbi:hypothetical protein Pla100_27710 [Neorhodopirellula pilleata]|uniref:Uncharacterized protein n=1 Tax=Neorhodopirellula pilleata TaxID=2714738 RepID=A0A5C6A8K4_9BACT|nr:hypothetical protein Pla100_27710 [Neorhodopirellula pilleata]